MRAGSALAKFVTNGWQGKEAFSMAMDHLSIPLPQLPALFPQTSRLPSLPAVLTRNRTWTLVGLFLFCLLIRTWYACRIHVICNDGALYIKLAQAWSEGNVEGGLGFLRLNSYPLILAGVHSLGLDWEAASKVWGVAIASLTILPLFGWLRRQFNDAVAIVGCLLYAAHPKLIEWSPQLIRDPTFWFAMALSIYALYRGIMEVRIRWHLVAGLAIALAIHTRFEGWFLYIPLFSWSLRRYLALPALRKKLVVGAILCILACPAAIWFCNVTLLRNNDKWEWGNYQRLGFVVEWGQSLWRGTFGSSNAESTSPTPQPATESTSPISSAPIAVSPAEPVQATKGAVEGTVSQPSPEQFPGAASSGEVSPGEVSLGAEALPSACPPLPAAPPPAAAERNAISVRLVWTFVNTFRRGIDEVYGLLVLLGLILWFREWQIGDLRPVLQVCMLTLGGIFVHNWYAQESSSRYALSIAILCTPIAALAVLWIANQLLVRAQGHASALSYALLATLAFMIAGLQWHKLAVVDTPDRVALATFGRWLRGEFGDDNRIAIPGHMALVGYYAHSPLEALPQFVSREELLRRIVDMEPNLVVLSRFRLIDEDFRWLVQRIEQKGFARLPDAALPQSCQGGEWQLWRKRLPAGPLANLPDTPSNHSTADRE